MVGVAIVLALMLWVEAARTPTEKIAQSMLGESWYRVQLNGDHVGFMYNHSHVDRRGQWHFFSTTHFLLQDNAPNTIAKHLIFDTQPPFRLLTATYTNRQNGTVYETKLVATDDGYRATIDRVGRTSEVDLDWRFDLETFVAFEEWLAAAPRMPNDQFLARTPDFEKLRVIQRAYRVVANNDEGYLVETSAPFAATQTQLDRNLRPLRLSMAGIFDVIATTEADAIALKNLRRKTNYLFAVDEPISNHTALASLELEVTSSAEVELPKRLSLVANPVTSRGDGAEYQGEALRYPVSAPAIQRLVRQSLSEQTDLDTVARLVRTAHQALRYALDQPAGSVLEALARGSGECTDYADLFTTLARAANLPARTVYGLAYQDGGTPGFLFHAWNEVYFEDEWRAVDPTWNQLRVDASHIPLTEAEAAAFMLANNVAGVSFSVKDLSYFD